MRAHRGVLGRADSGTIGAPCVLALRAPIAPARRASLRFELLCCRAVRATARGSPHSAARLPQGESSRREVECPGAADVAEVDEVAADVRERQRPCGSW